MQLSETIQLSNGMIFLNLNPNLTLDVFGTHLTTSIIVGTERKKIFSSTCTGNTWLLSKSRRTLGEPIGSLSTRSVGRDSIVSMMRLVEINIWLNINYNLKILETANATFPGDKIVITGTFEGI